MTQEDRMDWGKLLSPARAPGDGADPGTPGRPFYERDFERILFSASFRRLANKTQVHPLYQNDNLHHRLIHSVEVASVGHSLGYEVGLRLLKAGKISAEQVAALAGVTRAACLAHDIGNPPFGHSGEKAIGSWFAKTFAASRGKPFWDEITPEQRAEFEAFEGNAQGFRILTRNEMYHPELYPDHEGHPGGGMELSAAVLGAFTKYPATAAVSRTAKAAGESYCGLKKYGVFEGLLPQFGALAGTLGLLRREAFGGYWCRHPLVFLVEAADDICYNIMDLEDAFTSGDLPFERVRDLLLPVAGESNSYAALNGHPERLIANLRGKAINRAVQAGVEAFLAHYDEIMEGRFSGDLVDGGKLGGPFTEIEKVAHEEVFTTRRKTELEIYGRNLIYEILNQIDACVEAYAGADYDMAKLEKQDSYCARLLLVLDVDLLGVRDPYSALGAVVDFVSGMTDRYAVHVVKMLKGGL